MKVVGTVAQGKGCTVRTAAELSSLTWPSMAAGLFSTFDRIVMIALTGLNGPSAIIVLSGRTRTVAPGTQAEAASGDPSTHIRLTPGDGRRKVWNLPMVVVVMIVTAVRIALRVQNPAVVRRPRARQPEWRHTGLSMRACVAT